MSTSNPVTLEQANRAEGFPSDLLVDLRPDDGRGLRERLYTANVTPFRPDAEGYLHLPEGPGLGIDLNREALKRYGC